MKLSLDTSPSGIRFPFDFELYDVALPEGFPLCGRVGACSADRNHRGEDGDRRTPSEAIEKFAHYGNQIPLNGTSPQDHADGAADRAARLVLGGGVHQSIACRTASPDRVSRPNRGMNMREPPREAAC